MNINQKDRNQLKSYFVTGAVPKEKNYAELIDGMVNQKDDGLVKRAGNPLCIEAAGDSTSVKPALHLYDSFLDDDSAWALNLNPRVDPGDAESARRGLSIHDTGGTSRLFIDSASGNVGIGTLEPKASLHVAGTGEFTDLLTAKRLHVANPGQWLPAEFSGRWIAYNEEFGGPEFMKDSLGWVRMRGLIKGGASNPTLEVFRFPEGYRPLRRLCLGVIRYNNAMGRIDIEPDGVLRVVWGSAHWIALDNICFQAHH